MQARFEGRLFLRTPEQQFEKICQISLVREPIRIPMSLFWTRSSTSNIYKIDENPNCHSEANKHKNDYLSGRHVDNESISRGITNEQGHSSFSPATFRICNKFEKVCLASSSGNRIPGFANRLKQNGPVINTGKVVEDKETMFRYVQSTSNIHFDIDKVDRPSLINSPGCPSSTHTVSLPSTTSNKIFKQISVLPELSFSEQQIQGRTNVVDKKLRNLKREVSYSTSSTGTNADRCLQKGMGSMLQWNINRGSVVQGGTGNAHKYTRTISSKIGTLDIHKNETSKVDTHADRQYDCIVISPENGRDEKQKVNRNIQGNMGLPSNRTDHNYCRIFTERPECDSRLGVSTCRGWVRMETVNTSVPKNLSENGSTKCRSICIPTVSPTSSIHSLETGSSQSRDGCNATGLVTSSALCIPSIFTDLQGTQQSQTRQGSLNVVDNTHLADSALVCRTSANVHRETTVITSRQIPSYKPSRESSPPGAKQNLKVSGLESYRKNLVAKGVSYEATKLITGARKAGSLSNYESSWGKWTSWCGKKQIDPFQCPVNDILDYLTSLFKEGYAYRTIGCHRSAISAYHEHVDGKPVSTLMYVHYLLECLIIDLHNQDIPLYGIFKLS